MNCFRLITNCFFSVKNLRWRRSRTEIGNLFILEWIPVDPHHQLHQQLIVVVMINTLTRSAWLMICLQQRCSIIIIIINSNWRLVLDPKFYKNSLRSENNSNKTRNQRVFELRDFPSTWCCLFKFCQMLYFVENNCMCANRSLNCRNAENILSQLNLFKHFSDVCIYAFYPSELFCGGHFLWLLLWYLNPC